MEALAEEIKGKKRTVFGLLRDNDFLGGGTPSILEGVYTASIFVLCGKVSILRRMRK